MTARARVSVVLPAYDVAPFVEGTVASLAAQDWPEMELVVVDDGSTDGTAAALGRALEAFGRSGPGRRTELVSQGNAGLGAARNAALARATGELVLFADGDDLLDPGALSALAGRLFAAPGARLVFPRCRYIDERGTPLGLESGRRESPLAAADLLFENPIHTDTGVLLRRETLDRAGPFDSSLPSAIGLDAWIRVAAGGGDCISQLPQVLVSYRRRGRQITADWRRQRAGWETVGARARARGLLGPRRLARARARAMMVWAAGAYASGEAADLRRLMCGAALRDPVAVLGEDHGRLKLAAAAASLLPAPWEARLVAWHARRGGAHTGEERR